MSKSGNRALLLVLSLYLSMIGCSPTVAQPSGKSSASQEKSIAPPTTDPAATARTKADSQKIKTPLVVNAKTPEEKNPDRILVTVNGTSLTYEQAQFLVEHRVARDVAAAAQRWVDIQLKKQEAQRRNLDKIDRNAFIIQLYADNYLAFRILHDEIRKTIPPITETDARNKYEQQIKNYQRPATYNLQHITMAEKAEAEKAADEAKKSNADFNELVRRHSQNKDKNNLGRLLRFTDERIKRQFGEKITDAVKNAQPGDVLGPLPGLKDLEIIKVTSNTPAETIAFDKVKDRILQQMNAEIQRRTITKLLDDLKIKAKIEKSPELLALEKKAAETATPTPGRPNIGGRPARTIVPRTAPPTPLRPTPSTPSPKNDK